MAQKIDVASRLTSPVSFMNTPSLYQNENHQTLHSDEVLSFLYELGRLPDVTEIGRFS